MIMNISKKRDRYYECIDISNIDNNDDDVASKRSLYESNLNNEYHNYITKNYNDNDSSSLVRHTYNNNNSSSSCSSKYYNEHDAIEYDNSYDGYQYNNDNMQEMKDNDTECYDHDHDHDDDDGIESVLGFKSQRYEKKVDYLVDEIIKKCTRLNVKHNSISGAVSPDSIVDIPSAIGPHPLKSLSLSVIVPIESILSPSNLKLLNKSFSPNINNTNDDKKRFQSHSGNVTHSDWFIEETDENCGGDGNNNMDEDDDEDNSY